MEKNNFSEKGKILLGIFVLSFIFHIIWENTQAPLYEGYQSFIQHFWICFWPTVWDASYTVTLYLFIVICTKNWYWFKQVGIKENFLIVTIGLITATVVEKNALIQGKWGYNEWMPIMPILAVGLTPLIQLIIGAYVVFFLLSKIINNK